MKKSVVATGLWLGLCVLSLSVNAAQVCGNGVIEAPETCDDGNTVNGDACPNTCGVVAPTLGVQDDTTTEGNGGSPVMEFALLRPGNTNNPINFGVRTIQDTAFAGPDFTAIATGTRQVLRSGQGVGTVTVPLRVDLVAELDETFSIEISNAYEAGAITMIDTAAPRVTGDDTFQVVTADLDADGDLDLVAGNVAPDTVGVLRNGSSPGSFTFAAVSPYPVGDAPYGLAIGDIDGDGNPDIVSANFFAGTMTVLRHVDAPGSADFEAPVTFTQAVGLYELAVGDIDGDQRNDIVGVNLSTDAAYVWLNASGASGMALDAPVEFAMGNGPRSVALGDLDGDGLLDVVSANFDGGDMSVLRNTSSAGALSFAAAMALPMGNGPWDVALGDVDADGKADIVATQASNRLVGVLRNTSTPGALSFTGPVSFAVGHTPYYLDVRDIDGDGLVDVVAANYGANTVSVLRNTTFGTTVTFDTQQVYAAGTGPYGVVIGDFDGDAQADIATAANGDDGVKLIRNNRPVVAITTATATGTIVDDDEVMIAFASGTGAVNESAGTYTATVTLAGATDETVNVSYALSGTAVSGTDYTISPSTLTFAAGETSKTLTISGLADATTDGPATETIVITLQDPSNAGLNPPNPHTVTVTNDSNTPVVVPPPTPTPDPAPAAGGGGALNLGLLLLLGVSGALRRAARRASSAPATGKSR